MRPYGAPDSGEGDWLGIAERKSREPAGPARKTFRVSASQLVGAVFISRDGNPRLVDSSSREGFVQNEAFSDLRALVLGSVTILEAQYHDLFVRSQSAQQKSPNPREDVVILKREIKQLGRDLRSLSNQLPRSSAREVEKALSQVDEVAHRVSQTEAAITDLVSQTTVYRGLATIGVAAAVFGHETQTAIDEVLMAVGTSRGLITAKPPKLEDAQEELIKAHKYAKQVGAWGSFALARVKRDKRRRTHVHVNELLKGLVKDIKPAFDSANIDIKIHSENVRATTFAMDIEALTLNLLTNAYSACQLSSRKRQVLLELRLKRGNTKEGFSITVSDSGPGVPDAVKDMIWEPLFSTKVDRSNKPTGTGLGLAIVQSIVDELGGLKDVLRSDTLGGACFRIWLPLS